MSNVAKLAAGHPKDTCDCGDYRSQHVNGTGRCNLGSLCTPGPSCQQFRLHRQYLTENPHDQ